MSKLSTRARNGLRNYFDMNASEEKLLRLAATVADKELLGIPNFGHISLAEIRGTKNLPKNWPWLAMRVAE